MPVNVIVLSLTSCKSLPEYSRRPVLGHTKQPKKEKQLPCVKDLYGQVPNRKCLHAPGYLRKLSSDGLHKANPLFW